MSASPLGSLGVECSAEAAAPSWASVAWSALKLITAATVRRRRHPQHQPQADRHREPVEHDAQQRPDGPADQQPHVDRDRP